MSPQSVTMPKAQRGVIFLESLISIVIFSLGLLALLGLQARALNLNSDAKYRSDASFLANQAIALMQGDHNTRDSFAGSSTTTAKTAWLTQVQTTLPKGAARLELNPQAGDVDVVRITISWRAPNDTLTHQYILRTHVSYNS